MNISLLPDLLQTGALIAVVILYVFNEIRKEIKFRGHKRKSLDQNMIIDNTIYPILWELLSHYGCTRVFLTQFHNGDNFYTGQSIQRMTVSHEVHLRGVNKIKPTHENILISESNHRILMDLQRLNHFHTNIETTSKESELMDWMKFYSVGTVLMIRIIDGNKKETVAVLNMHWSEVKAKSDIKIFDVQEISKKLEKIFDEL